MKTHGKKIGADPPAQKIYDLWLYGDFYGAYGSLDDAKAAATLITGRRISWERENVTQTDCSRRHWVDTEWGDNTISEHLVWLEGIPERRLRRWHRELKPHLERKEATP